MPCPRCGGRAFSGLFVKKGTCWWCSQPAMTAVCGVEATPGCGLEVCKPCLERKLTKPLAPPSLAGPGPGDEEFSI